MTQSSRIAEAGVERRLAAGIVAERRIRDLDDEENIVGGKAANAARARKNHDVWLEIGILAEPKRRFRRQ